MLSGGNGVATRVDHWSEIAGLFVTGVSAMPGSKAHESTDQTTEEAVHAQIAGHGHQAKAGLAAADERLMIQRLVAEVESPGPNRPPSWLKLPRKTHVSSVPVWVCSSMRVPGFDRSRNARDLDGPGNSMGRMLTPGATRRRLPMR